MSRRPFRESRRQRRKRQEAERRFRDKWYSESNKLMQRIRNSQRRLAELKRQVEEYKQTHNL